MGTAISALISDPKPSDVQRGTDEWGNAVWFFMGKSIRVDESGPLPLFALVDCLKANGLSTDTHRRGNLGANFATSFGLKMLRVVTEEEFYNLTMRGCKACSDTFRVWLASVAKQIRTKGEYHEPGHPAQVESTSPIAQAKPASSIEALIQMSTMLTQSLVEMSGVKAIAIEARQEAAEAKQTSDDLSHRVQQLEHRKEKAEELTKSLPSPSVEAPQKSPCDLAEQRVRFYCQANGLDFRMAWTRFYEEFRRRCAIDAPARKRHQPEKYKTILDVVRELASDLQEKFYAISCELFLLEPRPMDGA